MRNMQELNHRFSEGWVRKVPGHKGYIDIRRSTYDIEKLGIEERRDFLRVLGIAYASVSEPHSNIVRVNVPDEWIMNYLCEQMPEEERSIRAKGRETPEVALKDPSFAYYFVNDLPSNLGQVQSGWLLEGIFTKAVADASWMDTKPKVAKQMLIDDGKTQSLDYHKVLFKTRNMNISDRIRFHLTQNNQHPMRWLPYDKGQSIGTWIPRPKDDDIQKYIIDSELRETLDSYHQFSYNLDDESMREIVILARRDVFEVAARKGWITVYEDQECRDLLDQIKYESRANEKKIEDLKEQRISAQQELEEQIAKLSPLEHAAERKRLTLQNQRTQTVYKKKILDLERNYQKLQERQKELEIMLDEAPKKHKSEKKRSTDYDPSYGRRQWESRPLE